MKQTRIYLFILIATAGSVNAQVYNTLSKAEKKAGWQLMFDGKTTAGWRAAYGTEFPKHGWVVRNGELLGELSKGAEAGDGGDIITLKKYTNFEMVFDWKLGAGGNSGVKYFIEERQPKPAKGYEYQLIDDANYIYENKKLPPDLKTGSIYDVIAARKPDTKMGTWHRSRIVVNNNHIEHWLDGVKVVDINRNDARFKEGVADSKFSHYPGFATLPEGYILLQDHGHQVAFRNLKIREL